MSASIDYGFFWQGEPPKLKKRFKSKRRRENRRRKVLQFYRDFPNCYYCGTLLRKDNRSLDHFIPRLEGGSNTFANLVTACQYCNQLKGSKLWNRDDTGSIDHADVQKIGFVGHAKAWRLFPCH